MKKQFSISGMSCGHCRASVEQALNGIEGVRATVALSPPVATVEFTGAERSPAELQRALDAAGGYRLTEM